VTPDPWDKEVLARTVFGEARGEAPEGQRAVAWVWLNRRDDPMGRWQPTVASCCLQPRQASCWDESDPNRALLTRATTAFGPLKPCADVAFGVLLGELPDNTGGANHYLRADLAERAPPYWYDPAKVTARVGRHLFLKL
jgi:N-acetylmuramoyl-L-alanine amidase